MISLSQLRRNRRLVRGVFAAFVLTWLQTAVVPCVMAASSSMTTSASVNTPHCVYCPPHSVSDGDHCNGDTSSTQHMCAYPDELRVDGSRAHQPQFEQPVFYALPIDWSPFNLAVVLDDVLPLCYLTAPVSSQPLNLTHCVQLK